MARRLVEAGVRVRHADATAAGTATARTSTSSATTAASSTSASRALIEDLDVRGMLDDVTVIAWGEFGRTPRINNDAGRDHWPQVSCACWPAAACRPARSIGATNRLGEHAKDRPVHFQRSLRHALPQPRASTRRRRPSPTRPAGRSTSPTRRRCASWSKARVLHYQPDAPARDDPSLARRAGTSLENVRWPSRSRRGSRVARARPRRSRPAWSRRAPNLKEWYVGLDRLPGGRWLAHVRETADGPDAATQELDASLAEYEAWEAAFEVYRNVVIILTPRLR